MRSVLRGACCNYRKERQQIHFSFVQLLCRLDINIGDDGESSKTLAAAAAAAAGKKFVGVQLYGLDAVSTSPVLRFVFV